MRPPRLVEIRFTLRFPMTPRLSRVAPRTLSIWHPRKPTTAGMRMRSESVGIVEGLRPNGARNPRTSHPKRAVYAAAARAHACPRREIAPFVPAGTFFPVVIRYAFGDSTPISLARVSAPATARTLTYTRPLSSGLGPAERNAKAATATGAIPFARTFEDRRSPMRPSWTPSASLSANRYRVAMKLERRKKSRRRSQVMFPRTPIRRPTPNAATDPSQVSTPR